MQTNLVMDRFRKNLASQLCDAVNDGNPRSVQLLLSKGASPDLVCSKGVAAIHLAVGKETEKNIRCLKMLLQRGADPNVRSSEGLTPLHIAALWGCYQNVKLLLINGGNPNIKDNDGNTPGQLAEQQENQRCAQVLQEYQASTTDTEEEDFPQFKYSLYSDQTDTSGYPESEYSFSSQASVTCDFGDAPWSSTRLSSFYNFPNTSGRPSCRELSFDGFSGACVLSSTRMSAVAPSAPTPVFDEDALCTDKEQFPTKGSKQHSAVDGARSPTRQTVRKSVSFRDIDEYCPVFSPERVEHSSAEGRQSSSTLPFSITEYSEFLDSERAATILPQQGIDVTSPDHVYVFCRESSESTEEEMEKTVINPYALDVSEDEQDAQKIQEPQAKALKQQGQSGAGSSSGTSSSHYSSCDSDHYTSALDASVNPKQEADMAPEDSNDKKMRQNPPSGVPTQLETDSNPKTVEPRPDLVKQTDEPNSDAPDGPLSDTHIKADTAKPVENTRSEAAAGLEGNDTFSFTPSPFVTGRTRSRLSRCSMRTSNNPESLLATSSLFEDTLPTPVRTPRQTARSQNGECPYSSPHTPYSTPSCLESCQQENDLPMGSLDSQSSTQSSLSKSQADTLILSRGDKSQSLDDTVILEHNRDNSLDAYEKNLAEIILAIRRQNLDNSEGKEFLTDDLTSADEETTKGNGASCREQVDCVINKDSWITESSSTQSDTASSSSTSSCFSPRRSREDSDLPCTPGTGCTPRYSMSRLSNSRRSERLADLSYTPGGRPLIQDLDEPVEYLYTDTEEGHRLIETHIPPTADTSISSSMSTTSSEETILYDWRSLHSEAKANKEKENVQPKTEVQKKENGDSKDSLLPEIKGITDKELRLRLVEMGESPGPISSRTRPTYMQRLCRLLQESKSPHPQKQSEKQTVNSSFSPELRVVLHTFKLPDCQADEQALWEQFDQPDQNRKWREGIIKSSFNYLLLDPRVTKNLPFRSHTMTPQECFQTFIHSIFYVGKGKRSRPYSHLYEALEYYKGEKTCKTLCPKVQQILQVWNAGQGVISLHCFQNVIPVEAYTREACMVEAIGLKMLTNQKRGDFYGVMSNWQMKRKRELGIHLLYRAMQIFLAEGERQLRPADIRQ
ncbi:ankyrin repeat and LEM domain-containing protein 1 isoform X2 [Oryzias melastigma]|uniref:Ankyrin repeat and LEM domain containing 1 n=1 Tax=Oryzias melastigma TaxID=30732 RepID=A0A3B3CNW8_ORYME|nr:ankyrin repeat and LEM domain-containing protein 1 isoform X2 [Oryzias melastigma]